MVRIGLYAGTRISEALALKFMDFKGDTLHIKSLKKSNDRYLEITDELRASVQELREFYEGQGITVTPWMPLFVSQKGGTISRQQGSHLIKGMFERAGIGGAVGFHSLRKSFCTKIFKLTGNDPFATAEYSGHKNINSLISYIESAKHADLTKKLAWG